MEQFATDILERIKDYVPELLMAVFIFLCFLLAAKILQKIALSAAAKFKMHANVSKLFSKTISITVILFGLVTALGTIGINVSAIVASLGLTGFALGFALKDTISNILSGVLILMYKPFEVGHYIKMGSFEGEVISIDLRYTELHLQNDKILIPNSKLFTDPIIVKDTQ